MPAVLPLVGDSELEQVFAVLGNTDAQYLGQTRVELLKQILVALCNT